MTDAAGGNFEISVIERSKIKSSVVEDFQYNVDDKYWDVSKKPSATGKFIKNHRNIFKSFSSYKEFVKPGIWIAITLGYVIYFGFAMSVQFGYYPFPFPNGNYILFILTIIAIVLIAWDVFLPMLNKRFRLSKKISNVLDRYAIIRTYVPIVVVIAIIIATVVTLLVFIIRSKQISALQSIFGILIVLSMLFVTSEHPEFVNWRIVIGGLIMQFWLGFFVMQTKFGFDLIKWIADRVEIFLNFSKSGAEFIYGDLINFNVFAINVLSIVMFMAATVSLLYYMGWMQWIIRKIGWLLSTILSTSPTESINSAANIFIGQSEVPLIMKPFLIHMTDSEIFAMLAGGFASVSGSVLGAFISLGIPSVHLVTASVMSAPCALALSKLKFPETQLTKVTLGLIRAYKGDTSSNGCIDALMQGARDGLKISGAILSSLIAVISLLAFFDSIVNWFFTMVHHPEIDFQTLIGYLFYPVAFFIGLSPRDCRVAGQLFGIKTFINEFVAFGELSSIIKQRSEMIHNGTFAEYDCELIKYNGTMLFENFVTSYILRAMIIGVCANIITASISGMLYDPNSASYIRNCTDIHNLL
ncbi:hypothetical protein GJ496_004130 [Pomphorhynchus laevis]|nr:hypothetical protein GJ496_004130 [Pomphorhynchus laevis]